MARKNAYVDGVKTVEGRNGIERHYLRFYDVDGKQKQIAAKNCKTRIDALNMLAGIHKRVADGLPGVSPVTEHEKAQGEITVEELAKLFKENYADPKVRDVKTYRRKAYSVLKCHVLPTLRGRTAASVKRLDVENLRDAMQLAGKSPRMIQKTIVQLSCLYRWAEAKGHVAVANPARGVTRPTPPESTDAYNDDEVARLLVWAAKHDPLLYDLISMAYYSGMRKGEIAGLRWEDVDLVNLRLYVKRSWRADSRKNGKIVVVPIHPRIGMILSSRAQSKPKPGDLVFMSRRGRMLPPRAWGIDKAVAETKVRKFKHAWHAFRHAHGTTLALAGAGLTEIRDALGQTTLTVAQRYVNIAAENRRKYIAAMPELGPAPPPSNVVDINAARQGKDQGKVDNDEAKTTTGKGA